YLRIPADADNGLNEFMLLHAALKDPAMREQAATRFALRNQDAGAPAALSEAGLAVQESARRALDVFAESGLHGITEFLEQNVPSEELPRAADVVVRLLGGAMSDLRVLVRERVGMPPLATDEAQWQRDDTWLRLSVAALSDLSFYPAPVVFMLSDFKHVQ